MTIKLIDAESLEKFNELNKKFNELKERLNKYANYVLINRIEDSFFRKQFSFYRTEILEFAKNKLVEEGLDLSKLVQIIDNINNLAQQNSTPIGSLINYKVSYFQLFPFWKALKLSRLSRYQNKSNQSKIGLFSYLKTYFKNRGSLDKLIDTHVLIGITSVTILNLWSPTIAVFLFVIYNILSVMVMKRLMRPKETLLNCYYLMISLYSVLAFCLNYYIKM